MIPRGIPRHNPHDASRHSWGFLPWCLEASFSGVYWTAQSWIYFMLSTKVSVKHGQCLSTTTNSDCLTVWELQCQSNCDVTMVVAIGLRMVKISAWEIRQFQVIGLEVTGTQNVPILGRGNSEAIRAQLTLNFWPLNFSVKIILSGCMLYFKMYLIHS